MRFRRRISKKMFRRLAAKNVKKSMKDYFIYFFTLTFAVCLFYTFNSIGDQFQAFQLPDSLNYLEAAKAAMAGVSVLVCAVVGFLIVYANRFLMKRRKKEFGIYCVLGMERKDISRLLMKEALRIGGGALIAGILLGLLFSQGLAMITGRIAGIGLEHYSVIFSPSAVLASILFFALTFFCVHVLNVSAVKKMKLIDLLDAEKKNEEVPKGKKSGTLSGLLGFLLVAAGYAVVFTQASKDLFKTIGTGSVLIGVGTLFLFLAVAGMLLELLKRRKRFYYRGLNLFVVNQLGSRLKSFGFSAAVVCILMYLAVSVMGIGLGMGQSFAVLNEKAAPYDVSIDYFYYGRTMDQNVKQNGMMAELERQRAELPAFLGETAEITFYVQPELKMTDVLGNGLQVDEELRKMLKESSVNFISIGDYNRLLEFQGKERISLDDGEYAVVYNAPESKSVLDDYEQQEGQTVKLGNSILKLRRGGIYENTLYNRNVLLNFVTLIVPQTVADRGQAEMRVMNGRLTDVQDGYDALQQDMLKTDGFDFLSREDIEVEFLADKLTASYIGGYLGMVFLITAGAVLALQQLTQTEDHEKRYGLLRKIGAGERLMKRSILAQMAFSFGLPFGIAAVHSGVVMAAVYRHIPYLTQGEIAGNVCLVAVIAGGLYGIYCMAAYSGSRRILGL